MGTGTGTTAQGGGVAGDNLSQHEARLRAAAAAAASIYEKSHVYPSANRLVWYGTFILVNCLLFIYLLLSALIVPLAF